MYACKSSTNYKAGKESRDLKVTKRKKQKVLNLMVKCYFEKLCKISKVLKEQYLVFNGEICILKYFVGKCDFKYFIIAVS